MHTLSSRPFQSFQPMRRWGTVGTDWQLRLMYPVKTKMTTPGDHIVWRPKLARRGCWKIFSLYMYLVSEGVKE